MSFKRSVATLLVLTGFADLSFASNSESYFDKQVSEFNEYRTFNWGECPAQFKTLDGRNECSFAQTPLNWEEPTGKVIEVLVSKYSATGGKSKGQLWMLSGGPGVSGSTYFPYVIEQDMPDIVRDYDVYILEHRGIGWSTELQCSYFDPKKCFDALHEVWGEGLFEFNTINAARDLKYAISKSKSLSWVPTYIYGISYGTMLAQRFTQIAPNGAQGIILDSVLPAHNSSTDLYEENADKVFTQLANYCNSDSYCSAKFITPVNESIRRSVQQHFAGVHCPDVSIDRDKLQQWSMAQISGLDKRSLLPFYSRLARCNDNDVIALNKAVLHYGLGKSIQILNRAKAVKDELKPNFSSSLFDLISMNEINYEKRSERERAEFCTNAIVCFDASYHAFSQSIQKTWANRYASEYIYKEIQHYIPTVALNGTLDHATPIHHAKDIQGSFTNINQRFIEVPFAPHGVVFNTGVKTAGEDICGVDIMESFMTNPWVSPDVSCLNDLSEFTFAVSAEYSQKVYGEDDAFGSFE
ncbi:hypothetical protein BGP78_04465 [Pseudoalteromonas sp. MSK9-3]|uniref:alpha/beta fold hydrolase n=1 Tax=Pseudoalteromonas sp. MSK9-3 TaxID=1897633 RepID=UPI000E6D2427|nr:alpha/beta fold hydrolase [Pseudoalteromonas sp. MSK9-3]RJE70834.1 hypothetical protein BGP78_04465 [Pseudoalteromonas sp. MSK9-3]